MQLWDSYYHLASRGDRWQTCWSCTSSSSMLPTFAANTGTRIHTPQTHNSSFWRQFTSSSYHNDRWDLSQADPKCSLYQLPWSQHVMSRSRSRSRGSYSYSSDYSSCSAKHREARSGNSSSFDNLDLFLFPWFSIGLACEIFAGKHHCYRGWCSSCCGAMCGPTLWVLGLVGNVL